MNDIQNQKVNDILSQYQNIIRPMIVSIEVDDVEYPIEIFNEIRAILNHISKISSLDSSAIGCEDQIDKEINDAQSHLKRAIFDCYKYSCLSADDKYKQFLYQTRHTDLSVVDNGEFIVKIVSMYDSAKKALKTAKCAEHDTVNNTYQQIFDAFQIAFTKYDALTSYLEKSLPNIEHACHKQNAERIVSYLIGIGGLIIGILGWFF